MSKNVHLEKCPECGTATHLIWGCMWDNDIEMCGNRDCKWEQYLPQSTMEDGEVIDMRDEGWE